MEEGPWKYLNFDFFRVEKKTISKGQCNFKKENTLCWCFLV